MPDARRPDPSSLDRLFRPKSVAIVGASGTPGKAGYMLVESLKGFDGEVFPINPKGGEILGLTAYPSLSAVGRPVDLVFLGVPAAASPDILREAAQIGAGAALIVSGGFGEAGDQGLQDEIGAICREGGIRLLGPNTSGFVVPPQGLLANFLPASKDMAPGRVAVVAQSGGINLALGFSLSNAGIGLALAVGLGNAVDVGVADMLEYLAGRDDVDALALHLEGVPQGRRVYEALAALTPRCPVVAFPVGRTEIGAFARSHTGNLMGSHALTSAALAQAGAVVVDSPVAVVDAIRALRHGRLAPNPDPGVGILTGQAGPGLAIVDRLNAARVRVPEIAAATQATIAGLLPPLTFMKNPVDTGRPDASFGRVAAALGTDPAIDAVLVYALYEHGSSDPVGGIAEGRRAFDKPVLFGTGGTPAEIDPLAEASEAAGVGCYDSPDRVATGMIALVEDARAQHRLRARPDAGGPPGATEVPAGPLDEAAAKAVVRALGIGAPPSVVAPDRAAAEAAFGDLAPPVAVKVLNPAVLHKTEVGGVHLGVSSADRLAAALDAIDAIPGGPHRYLIEEMAAPGLELILGGRRDPSWGPSVLVGLGGVAAEALGDVAVGLAPLGPEDARAMLGRLQGRALLDGWRGAPAVDREAVVRAIVALGNLLVANPRVAEIDLNPVRAYPDGLVALDALIVTEG